MNLANPDSSVGSFLAAPRARIAVIGAGAFGRFCLSAYAGSGDIDVAAVVDPDVDALAAVQHPGVRLETDWRPVVADPSIEVLHLATPPFARLDVVLAALVAGKSVFCEKPIALTLEEADTMIAAAHRSGVALGVNYVMRHHPLYRLLLRLTASGVAGTPRTFSFSNYAQTVPSGHWFWDQARSGGIFVEHGVHFFDIFGAIAGEADEVWGAAPRPEAVEATVRYRSGVVGRFYHEFAFPREVEHVSATVMYSRGRVSLEGWIPTRLSGEALGSAEALSTAAAGFPVHVAESDGIVRFEAAMPDREVAYREAIVAGMRDVIHRHRDPSWKLAVSAEAARTSLEVALAARAATETPQSRVTFVADTSA